MSLYDRILPSFLEQFCFLPHWCREQWRRGKGLPSCMRQRLDDLKRLQINWKICSCMHSIPVWFVWMNMIWRNCRANVVWSSSQAHLVMGIPQIMGRYVIRELLIKSRAYIQIHKLSSFIITAAKQSVLGFSLDLTWRWL